MPLLSVCKIYANFDHVELSKVSDPVQDGRVRYAKKPAELP